MSRCRRLIQGKDWREPNASLYIDKSHSVQLSIGPMPRGAQDDPEICRIKSWLGSGPIILDYRHLFLSWWRKNKPAALCSTRISVFVLPTSGYAATILLILPFVAALLIPLLGGSMATRRSHKKSRNGCEQCKRRRIKVCRPSTPPTSQYAHLHPVRRGQSMQELQPSGDGVHL